MIDPDVVFPDILTLLQCRAALHPDAMALEDVTTGEILSYARLLAQVEAMGQALVASGGRRIGIVLPNGAQLSIALLAAACAGTALPFNTALSLAEFAAYFREARLDLLIVRQDMSPEVAELASRMGLRVFCPSDLKMARSSERPLVAPGAEAIAMVLMTSGSTGRPKRAPLSHGNVCTSARDVARSLSLGPDDRCLSMWELFHIGGLVDLLLAPLHAGGTVIATPGFDTHRFFKVLREARPTWFQGVPTTLGDILSQQARNGANLRGSTLRLLRSVAAPLPTNRMVELEAAFGVPVLQTFGMTEAGPLITSTALAPEDRVPGSVGKSCGCEIRALLPDGRDAAPGTEGELVVRGPNVFGGYEDDPAANAAAFYKGWFKTGDLGRFDGLGNLYLTGRTKDLVNRGGEKINLREVDDALVTHPSIFEAASFAVQHPTLGEDIAAAVVLRPAAVWNANEVTKHLEAQLARFKLPASFIVIDSLPRNAVGKLDRIALAEQLKLAAVGGPDFVASELDLETTIADIWARELRLSRVSIDRSFFALGGDSLAALRVLMALEERFGVLPAEIAANRLDSVRRLALQISAVLREKTPDCAASELTNNLTFSDVHGNELLAVIAAGDLPPLRPGSGLKVANQNGSKVPIFWFFNAPNSEMYPFAEGLPSEQPLYGGYSCAHLFDWHDKAMHGLARTYTTELLREFPEGAFRLGGNCQGGRLAWLIAQNLEASGRDVEALALLEFSDPEIGQFSGRLLMMFGMHSDKQHYRPIRWGLPGWERQFVRPPVSVWIPGVHGHFFEPLFVGALTDAVRNFFENRQISAPGLRSIKGQAIWLIHKIPRLFSAFLDRYCDQQDLPRPDRKMENRL